jgi:predicted RNA binding protein YcfA (HicA-like mRNA interferase family)
MSTIHTYSRCRAINDKVRELIRQGWTAWRGGKHVRVQHPNGFTITVPGRPSDHRSERNWFAQLRRAEQMGFDPRMHG